MISEGNGFFGQIAGPFTTQDQIFDLIKEQCYTIVNQEEEIEYTIDYINKIGINYPIKNYGRVTQISSDPNPVYDDNQFKIQLGNGLNNTVFALGKTGMLELQDVNIKYIKVLQDVDDNFYIDYQYVPKPNN